MFIFKKILKRETGIQKAVSSWALTQKLWNPFPFVLKQMSRGWVVIILPFFTVEQKRDRRQDRKLLANLSSEKSCRNYYAISLFHTGKLMHSKTGFEFTGHYPDFYVCTFTLQHYFLYCMKGYFFETNLKIFICRYSMKTFYTENLYSELL